VSDIIFPNLAGLSITKRRTAQWSTDVKTSVSGRRLAIQHWSYPVWRYALSFEVLREAEGLTELRQVVGLFNRVAGRADTFLFDDEDDNAVTAEVFGLGTGSQASFQLTRTFGGFVEPVRALKAGVVLYANGVSVPGTLNLATGVATYTTAPAAGAVLSWTGGFYWRCRFDDDELDAERFLRRMWSAKKINFTTDK
jgi:uncharacterized protein (TIGR02217 family)